MFNEITLINYARPLADRAKARKSVGPYRWRPSQPGKGRGFYQASGQGLACDARGSTFDLRLELANDHLSGSRRSNINGYYCDAFGDGTLTPIIARLPKGRGFLAGWAMGAGMCASLDADIYETPEEAARAAHSMAESDADDMRAADSEEDDSGEDEDADIFG